MRSDYQYSMIISQMRGHTIIAIVEIDEEFFGKAKSFTEELIKYKRDESSSDVYLGDFNYYGDDGIIMKRYSVNDTKTEDGSGDVHFLQSDNYKYLLTRVNEFYRSKHQGFWSMLFNREHYNKIKENHNKEKVETILQKHFPVLYIK